VTPGDQGENQQDLEITRQVRRAITSNDELSQEAKNIKIVTMNGKVTLRGPVNSEQERKTIESIVQQVQGATVDDQLEVKGTKQ
jgi:osmotically-inducible protein OsmY